MYQTVYHVGDLSKKRQKPNLSYEGNTLSVSVHPKEWSKIAKKGGNVYKLTNPSANWFSATKANEKKATEWALQNGYIKSAVLYTLSWTDEETEDTFSTTFDNLEDAQAEFDYMEEDEGRNSKLTKTNQGLVLDKKGIHWWKRTFTSSPKTANLELIGNFVFLWFAEANEYDGVWWDEMLDIARLSAPRGGIYHVGK